MAQRHAATVRTLNHVIQVQKRRLLAKLVVRIVWGARRARARLAVSAQEMSINLLLPAALTVKAS